jgi:hypothetical protein
MSQTPGPDQRSAPRRTHEPGQDQFRFPGYPPALRTAVLVGDPSKAGPDVIRIHLPNGTKMMPHKQANRTASPGVPRPDQ